MPPAKGTPRVYQMRSNKIGGVVGAAICVYEAAQIWWVKQPVSAHETVRGNFVASGMFLAFAALIGLRLARLGAYPRERGVKVLNTYSTHFIPWADIGSFSLKSRLWFGRTEACWVSWRLPAYEMEEEPCQPSTPHRGVTRLR